MYALYTDYREKGIWWTSKERVGSISTQLDRMEEGRTRNVYLQSAEVVPRNRIRGEGEKWPSGEW